MFSIHLTHQHDIALWHRKRIHMCVRIHICINTHLLFYIGVFLYTLSGHNTRLQFRCVAEEDSETICDLQANIQTITMFWSELATLLHKRFIETTFKASLPWIKIGAASYEITSESYSRTEIYWLWKDCLWCNLVTFTNQYFSILKRIGRHFDEIFPTGGIESC